MTKLSFALCGLLLSVSTSTRAETHVGVTFARTSIDVSAEISGLLESVAVRLGDQVEAGAVLASFRDEPILRSLDSAKAALSSARDEVELYRVQHQQIIDKLERRSSLNGAISEEELATLRGDRDAAAARLRMAESTVAQRRVEVKGLEDDLDRTQIRAPFDGTISVTHQDAGAVLQPGMPVVRLLSTDLWLRFAVSPEVAKTLRVGQAVRFQHGTTELSYLATIQHIAPDVDPIADLVFVEGDIAAEMEDDLVVGIVAEVAIQP